MSDKLEKKEPLFRSSKEVEWAIEILGYGYIPHYSQFIKDDRNHLRNILSIYRLQLTEETELVVEGQTVRVPNRKVLKIKFSLLF